MLIVVPNGWATLLIGHSSLLLSSSTLRFQQRVLQAMTRMSRAVQRAGAWTRGTTDPRWLALEQRLVRNFETIHCSTKSV